LNEPTAPTAADLRPPLRERALTPALPLAFAALGLPCSPLPSNGAERPRRNSNLLQVRRRRPREKQIATSVSHASRRVASITPSLLRDFLVFLLPDSATLLCFFCPLTVISSFLFSLVPRSLLFLIFVSCLGSRKSKSRVCSSPRLIRARLRLPSRGAKKIRLSSVGLATAVAANFSNSAVLLSFSLALGALSSLITFSILSPSFLYTPSSLQRKTATALALHECPPRSLHPLRRIFPQIV